MLDLFLDFARPFAQVPLVSLLLAGVAAVLEVGS